LYWQVLRVKLFFGVVFCKKANLVHRHLHLRWANETIAQKHATFSAAYLKDEAERLKAATRASG